MENIVASQEMLNKLRDIHNGVKFALQAHVVKRDASETETILHQLDTRLAELINRITLVRR